MSIFKLPLFLMIGFVISHSSFALSSTEKIDYFRDWLANCRYAPTVMCNASTFVGLKEDQKFDFQLKISQASLDSPIEITFISTYELVDVSQPLFLHIDDQKPFKLWPDADYRAITAINEYQIIDKKIAKALIKKMIDGHRIYIDYTNNTGQPRQTSFSLLGFTASLTFIYSVQDFNTPQNASLWFQKIERYFRATTQCLQHSTEPSQLINLINSESYQLDLTLVNASGLHHCLISPDGKHLHAFQSQILPSNMTQKYIFALEPITETSCFHQEKFLSGDDTPLGFLYVNHCQ